MVDGNREWKFFDKVSLQSLRVGLITFFPNEDPLELFCATKSKFLCMGGNVGQSFNFGLNSEEGMDFGK